MDDSDRRWLSARAATAVLLATTPRATNFVVEARRTNNIVCSPFEPSKMDDDEEPPHFFLANKRAHLQLNQL
jgi:hypothetical protein